MTDPGVQSRRSTTRATLLVLLSACCFGSISVLSTLAINGGARLIDVLFWRYAIAAVLLVVVSGGIAAVRVPRRRAFDLALFTGGGQAAVAFTTLSALKYIPVASLVFLFYTYPTWVAIISAVRGVERLTAARVVALAISLAGIGLMVGLPGSGALHPAGVAFALGGAVLYAIYIPVINHYGSGLPPAVTSTYAAGGAALVLLVATLKDGAPRVVFTPLGWASIVTLAVICTVLAFIIFLRGLAVIGSVRTAIVSTVEPFWTALLGSLVLGQAIGPRVFIGGSMIAAAVVLLQVAGRSSSSLEA
ncbi:MAG: DMT family transporter [Gemmatimonadota bacterium]|nr:DMT family transporter [Gemmatimonadota bacterium]